METAAIASTSAQNTTKFIKQIYCRHGAPTILVSDNGTNFTSSLIRDLTENYGIKHLFTTPYHPQANGQVERVNASIANMLSLYVNEYHSNWDELLPYITFAYNTNPHLSLKMTPFELLYGRKAVTPDEKGIPVEVPSFNRQEHMEFIRKEWPVMREFVKNNMEEARSKNESDYNEAHSDAEFEKGDKVLIHYPNITSPGLANKLCHKYRGPFTIVEKRSPQVYTVKEDGTTKPPQPVNIQRMKRYREREQVDETLALPPIPILPNWDVDEPTVTDVTDDEEEGKKAARLHPNTSSSPEVGNSKSFDTQSSNVSWHDTEDFFEFSHTLNGPTTSTPKGNRTYTIGSPRCLAYDPQWTASGSRDSSLPNSDLSPTKQCQNCELPLVRHPSSSSLSSFEQPAKHAFSRS